MIGGRYRLLAPLGAGPSGTVWRARDESASRDVAVKEPVLPGDPVDDEESRRAAHRLYREARTAARVRHPSAVTLHDVVTEDGLPWIVMELVEGESLREAVRRGPLRPAEAARIGLAVLGALRAAHAVGIVHRDIKPANVLIEAGTGRVVVTDFGIGDRHAQEAPAGFVAPERASGPGAGPASDLWSLGALLAAAVEGGDAGALEPLLTRLHAPDPAERPDAAEVAAALEACAGTTPAAAPTGPAPAHDPEPAPAHEPEPAAVHEPAAAHDPEPVANSQAPATVPGTAPGTDPRPGPRADPPADPPRRTPFAALGLLLARKPGAE
ncbi:serine/threonine protein kinase [Streptomyces collinus Tu 365]|uniref:non-specific serine/threonine protein kinase n=1 Tax=Streptomyces collinus (strain DSM 40733 / Tue 365) TaxID=1214242 RepID=S5V833_STRC3|nr:serine/threonine protein kinase [Streptomyces collinus Tu 365]